MIGGVTDIWVTYSFRFGWRRAQSLPLAGHGVSRPAWYNLALLAVIIGYEFFQWPEWGFSLKSINCLRLTYVLCIMVF